MRLNDHRAGQALIVDIQPESGLDESSPLIVSDPVTVVGKLQTDEPPTKESLANAIRGIFRNALGTGSALTRAEIDLAINYFRAVVTPTASAGLTVEYHAAPYRSRFNIEINGNASYASTSTAPGCGNTHNAYESRETTSITTKTPGVIFFSPGYGWYGDYQDPSAAPELEMTGSGLRTQHLEFRNACNPEVTLETKDLSCSATVSWISTLDVHGNDETIAFYQTYSQPSQTLSGDCNATAGAYGFNWMDAWNQNHPNETFTFVGRLPLQDVVNCRVKNLNTSGNEAASGSNPTPRPGATGSWTSSLSWHIMLDRVACERAS